MNVNDIFLAIEKDLVEIKNKRQRLSLKRFAKKNVILSPIHWDEHKMPDYAKKEYALEELISIPSLFFIEAMYLSLLKRPPDQKGHHFYQQELLNGISKAEIIARMAYSKEVRAKKIKVSGVFIYGVKFALSRVPLVSNISSFLYTLFSLPSLLKDLRGLKNQIDFKEHMLRLAVDDLTNNTNLRLDFFRLANYDNFLNIDDKFKLLEQKERTLKKKKKHNGKDMQPTRKRKIN